MRVGRRRVSSARASRARAVPRHARRHGPHRPHPRGRVPHRSASRRRGSGRRASASTTSTRSSTRSQRRQRVAVHRRLDRLPRARRVAGPRHPDRGRWAEPDERRREPPQRPCRSRCRSSCRSSCSAADDRARSTRLSTAARRRAKRGIVDPETFFYPLDAHRALEPHVRPRGFTQYQCVLPARPGRAAVRELLELLAQRGGASFLCVIKDCGPEGDGMLSFPKPGISIALDIPIRDDTQALVDALNEHVIATAAASTWPRTASRAPSTSARWSRASPRSRPSAGSGIPQRTPAERAVGAPVREIRA